MPLVEKAWTWKCSFGLCIYVFPTKDLLIRDGKPEPNAVPVRVEIRELVKKKKK